MQGQDARTVSHQIGRPVRGLLGVAERCECGDPRVVTTRPRLDDGTPFPTFYYLTCPRLCAAVSTLESEGLMRRMQERLATDPRLAQAYLDAHRSYIEQREAHGEVPEISGISAGGMPDRVKCLHVLAAHALAAGPGVNPLGDEVLGVLADRGYLPARGRCIPEGAQDDANQEGVE